MARVFLSYSRQDQSSAKAIATALERCDHQVWWDRHLEGGSRYATEIEDELKRADAVVVLWSHASTQSPWVQDEAAEGRNSGRLVPVVIDDSQPPLGFRQFQAIDLSQWNGRPGAKVLESVDRAIAVRLASGKGDIPEAPAKPHRRHSGLWFTRRAFICATVALFILMSGVLYWRNAGEDRPDLRVRLAAFNSLSSGVSESVPKVLKEEILAAFGTDALITATLGNEKSQKKAAAYVLAGSVRKVGDELRFTMHLTDADSGDTLWTQMLKRPAASVEVAPRQIAVAVSQILRCALTGKAQHPGKFSNEALSAYLSYCQEYMADSAGNVMNPARALDIARRVVELSPDFSRGWSARAWAAVYDSRSAQAATVPALRAEAEQAARKAIKLDPKNSQAYEVLSGLKPRNSLEREKLLVKAVSVRPGDCGCEFVGYGGFLQNVGRMEAAVEAFKRAHDMVPLSADVNASLAEALFLTGKAAEARTIVESLLEVWPNDPVRELLVRSAFWTKDYRPALAALADPRSPFSDEERKAYSAAIRALQSGSAVQKASAIGQVLELTARGSDDQRILVSALAALGADRDALALADKLVGRDGSRDEYLLFEPPLDRVRRMPEFAAIVQRIGLLEYWRQSRHPPDFCREPKAPALCGRLS